MKLTALVLVIAASLSVVDSHLLSLLKTIFKTNYKDKNCVKSPSCAKVSYYGNVDGSCNNVNKPSLGMAGLPYGRLCDAAYGDGKSALSTARSGNPLPNPRLCSYTLFLERENNDTMYTIATQQMGQFITHDMSATSGITQTHQCVVSCCSRDKNFLTRALSDPRCAPITIPDCDPAYKAEGTLCLHVERTLTTKDKKCQPSDCPVAPISDVTPWLDLSQVYGSTVEVSVSIREKEGGRLKAECRDGQSWPPQDPKYPCLGQEKDAPCYLAGDFRVNQNPHLTVLQIVFFREHNRLCKELSILNPHWGDERLFQEARRILIATYQHIVYYHYLPIIIGYNKAVSDELIFPDKFGYACTYNNEIEPSIFVEFATAAFRFFHSNIYGKLQYFEENRKSCGEIYLRDYYMSPAFLEKESNFDKLARGMTTQSMRASDQYYDTDVTLYLFKGDQKLGSDLRAIDIQRSRDHGLTSYVNVRKICGLPVPTKFCDLLEYGISKENVEKLEKLYDCVEDMELTVVGALEPLEKDAQCGATYQCIISLQFMRSRVSDRFFYEDGTDPNVALPLDKLKAIRSGASLSRIICDNIPSIKKMQPNAFVQISKTNKIVTCDELPSIDLKYWKDK